jgi:hypothetical protein
MSLPLEEPIGEQIYIMITKPENTNESGSCEAREMTSSAAEIEASFNELWDRLEAIDETD